MNYTIIFICLLIVNILFLFRYCFFIFMLLPIRCIMKKKAREGKVVLDKKATEKSIQQKERLYNKLVKYIHGYMRYFIFRVGYIPSHRIRGFIYRNILLVNLSDTAIIYFGAEIRDPYKLKVGKGTIIGDQVVLDARNNITIGDNVNFSSKVSIWTEQHDHRDPYFRCNSNSSFAVTIKDRAWIGPNVTILHGVTVGQGSVVAAGSIVTKDVGDYMIVAGVPAKVIGERNHDLRYEFDGKYTPFY